MAKKEVVQEQPMEITLEILKHNNKMQEMENERGTEKLKHEMAQERHRIENAECKKQDMQHFEREKDVILFRKDNWISTKKPGEKRF